VLQKGKPFLLQQGHASCYSSYKPLVVIFSFFLLYFLLFSFWSLCCLSFFDLRILITSLVSSNFSPFFFRSHWDIRGFTTTCAISAYRQLKRELESRSWRGVLDTTLCDKVCEWLASGYYVSPINKTDRHDITEIVIVDCSVHHNAELNMWKHGFDKPY
jgi:hypothetical protein